MSFTPGWSVVPGEVATATKMSQLGGNDDYLKAAIDTSTPAGVIAAYAGATEPDGWLICDGRPVSRSTYANLFAVIGTSHGAGDGSTTFNLPDGRERTIVGYKSGSAEFGSIGAKTGEKSVTLSASQMPVHSHGVNDPGHGHYLPAILDNYGGGSTNNALTNYPGANVRIANRWTEGSGTGIWLSNAGGGAAHNNIQPSIVENLIIKY